MTSIDYSTVVVGLDGSEQSLRALRFAEREVALRGSDATLVGVAALTDPLGLGRDDQAEAERSEALHHHLASVITDPSIPIEVIAGPPAKVLSEAAASAALLVIGKRGHGGFQDLLLGSTAISCLRLATCPLVVLPNEVEDLPQRPIVVGIDDSSASHRALAWAVEEAIFRDISIEAIATWRKPHLWEPIQGSAEHYRALAERLLEAAIASVDPLGRTIEAHCIEGHLAETVVKRSATAGAVVIGNETHEGGRIHGQSIAIPVIAHAQSPVVACG